MEDLQGKEHFAKSKNEQSGILDFGQLQPPPANLCLTTLHAKVTYLQQLTRVSMTKQW